MEEISDKMEDIQWRISINSKPFLYALLIGERREMHIADNRIGRESIFTDVADIIKITQNDHL